MPLHVFFENAAPLRAWITAGAPIPGLEPFTHFGNGERPRRSPATAIENRQAFQRFLGKGNGCLYAKWGYLDTLWLDCNPAELAFWEYSSPNKKRPSIVLQHASRLFEFLDQFRPYFGAAYCFEEWSERHLYKYQTDWARRPNTSPVGKDVRRYVPGLYWLNCFGPACVQKYQVNIEKIVTRLGGNARQLPQSVLVQLFDNPEHWHQYNDEIAMFLQETDGFFSLSRVDRLPAGLSMREITDATIRVTAPWP